MMKLEEGKLWKKNKLDNVFWVDIAHKKVN